MIEKYHDRISFFELSLDCNISLSKSFYKRYANRLNWSLVAEFHKLSEAAIEKFVDRLNWDYISEFQDLSDAFIEKHGSKIDNEDLSRNRLIIRRRLLDELCWNVGTISEKNNNYFSRDVANEVLGFVKFDIWKLTRIL